MTRKEQILDVVERTGPVRRGDIAEALGIDEDYAGAILSELAKETPPRLKKHEKGLYDLPERVESSHPSDVEDEPAESISLPHGPSSQTSDLADLFSSKTEMEIHTDVHVAAGEGRVVYPETDTYHVTLPRGFLSEVIGFHPPQRIGVMWAEGDSMKPTIRKEEMVIYEPIEQIRAAGVYVIHLTHGLVVKRVQPLSDGGYRIISDNDYQQYLNETLIPTDDVGTYTKEDTGRTAQMWPVGKVLFPDRNTDEMHVKQVSQIIRSVVDGAPNIRQLQN